MRVDCLVAEIGSTTTTISAFDGLSGPHPRFLGQGQAATSVLAGDVRIGLEQASRELALQLGVTCVTSTTTLATSSAAGGLRMSVHGLVHDMTVRAAREAALGAGAVLKCVTSGLLRPRELERLKALQPNIILLAGGVDHGERETALSNAAMLAGLDLPAVLVYAGNSENRDQIRALFEGSRTELRITENVYPAIDELNVEPTRRLIQDLFEAHIVEAPGMLRLREKVQGVVMPTPAAVLTMARLLYPVLGDLLVLDVGGATTDVHSVAEASGLYHQIAPEPFAKRTVEGDLGVYLNRSNVLRDDDRVRLAEDLGIGSDELDQRIERQPPVPHQDEQKELACLLAQRCIDRAIRRHVGSLRIAYGLSGRQQYALGRDLTQVKRLLATGGALVRLPGCEIAPDRLRECQTDGSLLLPGHNLEVLLDRHYILAPLGVLSKRYPEAAVTLALESLNHTAPLYRV